MRRFYFLFALVTLFTTSTALAQKPAAKAIFKVEYEKFILPNGLQVIFHIDRSDPMVAVSLTAHVGPAREKASRTGFAHFYSVPAFSHHTP